MIFVFKWGKIVKCISETIMMNQLLIRVASTPNFLEKAGSHVKQEYPLNLSILLSGGEEIN